MAALKKWTGRLPWPPSVNSYLQPMKNGRGKYLTIRGKRFRLEVSTMVAAPPKLVGRLAVSIGLTPPDRRKRDIDNHCKAVLDALQFAGVYLDDAQIDRLHVERTGLIGGEGAADVIVEELT